MVRELCLIILFSISLTACSASAQNTIGLQWWEWLIIILLLIFVFWLVLRKQPEETLKSEMRAASKPEDSEPVTTDDLKVIEGIGPKIESVLNAAGIHSYSQLAKLDAGRISGILSEGGIRLAFPESWPEQASLAAEGAMDKLRILQDQLKAGREE